jgi:predicted ATPase
VTVPSNVPEAVSIFVGRDADVAPVVALLERARLVALSGSGGTGKTRLPLAVAERIRDHLSGGAWFVGLAPVRDPDLVPSAIAPGLGIEEEAGRPIGDTLKAALRDRDALLVLDNFEQVAIGGVDLPGAHGVGLRTGS